MRQKTGTQTSAAEKTIKDIRRATRKHHSAEDKSVPALTSPAAVESARQGAFLLQNTATALSLQAILSTTDPAVR